MIFGPDYHFCEVERLPDRHIDALAAILAGFPYIDSWRESLTAQDSGE